MSDRSGSAACLTAGNEHRASVNTLGMVVFLASETMLFAGMFGLYAAYRSRYPADFIAGVGQNLRWIGTLNTYILLTSSWCIAMAANRLRAARPRQAAWLGFATILLGLSFLGLKGTEYVHHIRDRVVPGHGASSGGQGADIFTTLYYLMTGTHALHVIAGLGLLVWALWRSIRRGDAHLLELAAIYWHFVDVMWVFLWPMFYLMGRPVS